MIAALLLPILAEATAPATLADRFDACLFLAQEDPISAYETAGKWSKDAKAAERAQALQCLGTALVNLGNWETAEQTLLQAHDAAPEDDRKSRAHLAAMAGNAALADNRNEAALSALDVARADALADGDKILLAGIESDRARALVALNRNGEAASALAAATAGNPEDWEAWLLSATLARRQGNLTAAQGDIEKAAALRPVDLDIGLEAGVIAVLSGHDEAARRSWQSVVDADPASQQGLQAKAYIMQLGKP